MPYLQATPTWQHQAISVELASQFNAYVIGKPCRVFAAPFDLLIPELDESDEEISDIISQPDIVWFVMKVSLGKQVISGYQPL